MLKENGPQMEFVALSPQARNLIVMTVRAVNHVVANKQQYKEKDANTSFIQYLLSSAAPKYATPCAQLLLLHLIWFIVVGRRTALKKGAGTVRCPMHRNQRSRFLRRLWKRRHQGYPGTLRLPFRQMTTRGTIVFRRGVATAPKLASPRLRSSTTRMGMVAEVLSQRLPLIIGYRYIIRKEQNDRIDEFREDDDEPSQPNIVPIVIKPKSEAVRNVINMLQGLEY